MIAPTCPQCKQIIPSNEINVLEDVAHCPDCKLSHSFVDIIKSFYLNQVDLNAPPAGMQRLTLGSETMLTASHRSLKNFVGVIMGLVIGVFWNSLVTLFIWSMLKEGVPIFMWLFLTPFILIGLIIIGAVFWGFFMLIGGKTVVRVSPEQASVFTGVGFIGRLQHFDPKLVKAVYIGEGLDKASQNGQVEISLKIPNHALDIEEVHAQGDVAMVVEDGRGKRDGNRCGNVGVGVRRVRGVALDEGDVRAKDEVGAAGIIDRDRAIQDVSMTEGVFEGRGGRATEFAVQIPSAFGVTDLTRRKKLFLAGYRLKA